MRIVMGLDAPKRGVSKEWFHGTTRAVPKEAPDRRRSRFLAAIPTGFEQSGLLRSLGDRRVERERGVILMTAGSESAITFLVSYRCGCCQTPLQAPVERSSAWLRCPLCGRGGLPPEQVLKKRSTFGPIMAGEEVMVIGPARELTAMTPVAVARGTAAEHTPADFEPTRSPPGRDDRPGDGLRVAYASVLFIALTLLLFSYLDQSVIGTSITGAVALVALVLLLLKSRDPRLD
ncbi:MAG: hypothetical protein AB7I30_10705 [Isosphaeraceae bacterium]